MIKCQVCGYDNQDNAEFCLNCGATIEREKLSEAIDDISAERTVVLDPRAFQTPAPVKAAPAPTPAAPPPPAAPAPPPAARPAAHSAPAPAPPMPSAPPAAPSARPTASAPATQSAPPSHSTPQVTGQGGGMDPQTRMIIIGMGALIIVLLVVLIMVALK